MKDWPEENVRLLFRQRKRRKYPINVKMIVAAEKKILLTFQGFLRKIYLRIRSVFVGGGEIDD
jgi:hypothetical protein